MSVHPPEMANSKCSVTNATYAEWAHSRSVRSAGRALDSHSMEKQAES